MSEIEIKNAKITNVDLSISDYGLLTMWVTLDYGGSGQGFGGYSLYLPKSFKHHEKKCFAGHFIFRLFEIADVESYKDLVGKTIRVKCEHSGVHAIGHILKDDWFNPSEELK